MQTQIDIRKDYNKRLGAQIRHWREFKGYTQQQLSFELGILDNTTISRYESGLIEMSVYRLAEIAKILGVSLLSLTPNQY